jgi:putative peptide zinc metalloprotease protein
VRKKAQEIECPDCLRKRLRVFRVEKAGLRTYLIVDPLQNRTYELEPWQFFALEILHECEDFSGLSLAIEDRYGEPIARKDVEELFAVIAERKWYGVSAATNPLLLDFKWGGRSPSARSALYALSPDLDSEGRRSAEGRSTEAAHRPERGAVAGSAGDRGRGGLADSGDMVLPAEVDHALGLDGRMSRKGWKLFDPTGLLGLVHPLALPFRHAVYLVPFVLVPALFVFFRYDYRFADDLATWFGDISFAGHAVFGLLTVNLLATAITALVAHNYGATVREFCLVFYFVIYPRFMVRVGNLERLSRRELLWLYAAPLLLRLTVFSIGVLVWFETRHMEGLPAKSGLALSVIGQFSFLLTVNPLMKSNGYRLIATLVNEPDLREKALNALSNALRGKGVRGADNRLLVVYALASVLFMIVAIAVFLLVFGVFLKSHLSGPGLVLLVVVGAIMCLRIATKLRKLGLANVRSTRFAEWRSRNVPKTD